MVAVNPTPLAAQALAAPGSDALATLTLKVPTQVEVGVIAEGFVVTLTNTSASPITNVAVNLGVPLDWQASPNQPAQEAKLGAGASLTVSWSVTIPGVTSGLYPIHAGATFADPNGGPVHVLGADAQTQALRTLHLATIDLTPRTGFVSAGQSLTVTATMANISQANLTSIAISLTGMTATPIDPQPITLSPGASVSVRFNIVFPIPMAAGSFSLYPAATYQGPAGGGHAGAIGDGSYFFNLGATTAVVLAAAPPPAVAAGSIEGLNFLFTNQGDTTVSIPTGQVSVQLPAGWNLIASTTGTPALDPGNAASGTVSFQVPAGTPPGPVTLPASLSYLGPNGPGIATTSVVLPVTAGPGAGPVEMRLYSMGIIQGTIGSTILSGDLSDSGTAALQSPVFAVRAPSGWTSPAPQSIANVSPGSSGALPATTLVVPPNPTPGNYVITATVSWSGPASGSLSQSFLLAVAPPSLTVSQVSAAAGPSGSEIVRWVPPVAVEEGHGYPLHYAVYAFSYPGVRHMFETSGVGLEATGLTAGSWYVFTVSTWDPTSSTWSQWSNWSTWVRDGG
jgi:hypothetical protein